MVAPGMLVYVPVAIGAACRANAGFVQFKMILLPESWMFSGMGASATVMGVTLTSSKPR